MASSPKNTNTSTTSSSSLDEEEVAQYLKTDEKKLMKKVLDSSTGKIKSLEVIV